MESLVVMNNNLLNKFEMMLDNEAKRVIQLIIKMYEDGIMVNQSFESLVRSLIDKKFNYYVCDIQLRIYTFLPRNLEPDQNSVFSLITRSEATQNHLLSYIDWCQKDIKDKDHYKAAEQMAIKLIEYANKHRNTKMTLVELVAKYMPDFFPIHHDSVDSRAVVLLLEDEINNNGYEVLSLAPFRIMKI